METAIKKAIEGGWRPKEEPCRHILMHDENGCPFGFHYPDEYKRVLDPIFWQCLGKAEGWNPVGETVPSWDGGRVLSGEWLSYWHSFINHLAEGKDAESFFKELLK